jgi:hypothetical protein
MTLGPGIEDDHDDILLVNNRCIGQFDKWTGIDSNREQGSEFQEFSA